MSGQKLYLHARVDTKAALAAGYTTAGDTTIPITDELLAQLDGPERAVLAEYAASISVGSHQCRLLIDVPTAEAAMAAIKAEAARRVEAENKLARDRAFVESLAAGPDEDLIEVDSDGTLRALPGIVGLPYNTPGREALGKRIETVIRVKTFEALTGDELTAALVWGATGPHAEPSHNAKRAGGEWLARAQALARAARQEYAHQAELQRAKSAAADEARCQTIVAFLADHGSTSQCERYDADCLPTDELLDLVRGVVFKPLDSALRFVPLPDDCVTHYSECAQYGEVEFSTDDLDNAPLSDAQWKILTRIKKAVRDTEIQIGIRSHVGECSECEARVSKYAARAVIEWAGRTLSREYDLDN